MRFPRGVREYLKYIAITITNALTKTMPTSTNHQYTALVSTPTIIVVSLARQIRSTMSGSNDPDDELADTIGSCCICC